MLKLAMMFYQIKSQKFTLYILSYEFISYRKRILNILNPINMGWWNYIFETQGA